MHVTYYAQKACQLTQELQEVQAQPAFAPTEIAAKRERCAELRGKLERLYAEKRRAQAGEPRHIRGD